MTTSKKVIKEGKHHLKPDPPFPTPKPPKKARRDKRRKTLDGPKREDFYDYKVVLAEPPSTYQMTSTERSLRRDKCDEAGHHTFIRCPRPIEERKWDKETKTSRLLCIRHGWTIRCGVCFEHFYSWRYRKGGIVPPEAIDIEWVDATPAERARYRDDPL